MRELERDELRSVAGGIGMIGAGIGAFIGIGSAIRNNASVSQTLAAGALGALSGAAGSFAGSAAAGNLIVRGAWAVRSVDLGVASSEAAAGAGIPITDQGEKLDDST